MIEFARAACRMGQRAISSPKKIVSRTALAFRPRAPVGVVSVKTWFEGEARSDVERLIELPPPATYPRRPAHSLAGQEMFRQASQSYVVTENPPRRVAEFDGARVATEVGLVITRDNRVIKESGFDAEARGLKLGRLPRAKRLRARVATLVSVSSHQYYHWLVDGLPRIGLLRDTGFGEVPLLVSEPLTQFQAESLELVGVPSHQLIGIPLSQDLHVRPERLVFAQPAAVTGYRPQRPHADWVCAWLRDELREVRSESRGRRLYISRNDLPSGQPRRVANEAEVIRALRPRGFDVVHAERLTFAEQVRLFSEAAVVIGPHGSGMTNVMFAERLVLIEMFEPRKIHPLYHALASAAGHEYWFVIGESAGEWDIHVPVDKLLATLDAALDHASDF